MRPPYARSYTHNRQLWQYLGYSSHCPQEKSWNYRRFCTIRFQIYTYQRRHRGHRRSSLYSQVQNLPTSRCVDTELVTVSRNTGEIMAALGHYAPVVSAIPSTEDTSFTVVVFSATLIVRRMSENESSTQFRQYSLQHRRPTPPCQAAKLVATSALSAGDTSTGAAAATRTGDIKLYASLQYRHFGRLKRRYRQKYLLPESRLPRSRLTPGTVSSGLL